MIDNHRDDLEQADDMAYLVSGLWSGMLQGIDGYPTE